MFLILTALNSLNYGLNSRDQYELEECGQLKEHKWRDWITWSEWEKWGYRNNIELAFLGIMILLVLGAHCLIKDC